MSPNRLALCVADWALALVCLGVVIGSDPAHCSESPSGSLEGWVRERVDRGEVANALDYAKDEQSRTISATFLQDVILGGGAVQGPTRVRIEHAIVQGTVSITGATIPAELSLYDITFRDRVEIAASSFLRPLTFDHSAFYTDIDLRGTEFHSLYLRNAKIAGSIDLRHAEVERVLDLSDAVVAGRLMAAGAALGEATYVRNAQFNGEVDLRDARVRGQFFGAGANFKSPTDAAQFSGVEIGGRLDFNDARFDGGLHLGRANVGASLLLRSARFTNPAKTAYFNAMRVGGGVVLDEAEFHGPVHFRAAKVGGSIAGNSPKFLFSDHPVEMDGIRADGGIMITNFVAAAPLQFGYSRGSYLSLACSAVATCPLRVRGNAPAKSRDYSL